MSAHVLRTLTQLTYFYTLQPHVLHSEISFYGWLFTIKYVLTFSQTQPQSAYYLLREKIEYFI